MAELKELRRLKDEERTLMSIATKLSDQLNRLKVEELALLSRIRQGDTDSVGTSAEPQPDEELPQSTSQPEEFKIEEEEELVPLDLSVNRGRQQAEEGYDDDEEEEDDDDEFGGDLDMMRHQLK